MSKGQSGLDLGKPANVNDGWNPKDLVFLYFQNWVYMIPPEASDLEAIGVADTAKGLVQY